MYGFLIVCLLAVGCGTFQAGRLYSEGTRALDRGAISSAVESLERAGELAPQASEIQNHLGLAYVAAGRDLEALAAFERAVALDCDNSAAAQNLATSQARHITELADDSVMPAATHP